MIVRKLRLQRGWTQSQLAEMTDVTVRTIQRIERGHRPSLETCKALAAVFEVDFSTFTLEEDAMNQDKTILVDEQEAILHAKRVKSFYEHLGSYLLVTVIFTSLTLFTPFPSGKELILALIMGGMGIGILIQGLVTFEVISFLSPNWEKKLIEKRLGRKL